MPTFQVATGRQTYSCLVERGLLGRIGEFLPAGFGKIFLTTTQDVWELYRDRVSQALKHCPFEVLIFRGGEANKHFQEVERLAEEMVERGADRASLVIALGGGIVNDMGGFLASIFMRGIPVLQVPTTLLAQVDAAVGGKTGVNLRSGKNLLGTFHQPAAVLVDPDVLQTLPDREYRAGLYEVIKYGVIASSELFRLLADRSKEVLSRCPEIVERIISESVRIKAEVVSADEREGDIRRILNFGHTIGHALEAETGYTRYLHGEAVAIGMCAATHLAAGVGLLGREDLTTILRVIERYGPVPATERISAEALLRRLTRDKKTIKSKVHFVLPDRIGHVVVRSGIADNDILNAIRSVLS